MPPASRGTPELPSLSALDLLDTLAPSASWLSRIAKASIDTQTKSAVLTSAVVRAASSGDADVLEFAFAQSWRTLISADGKDSDGVPAIVLATSYHHGDCVRTLVEAGADVNARDTAGWTALHWAVQGCDFPLAAYLLNHGAQLEATSYKGLRPADLVRKGAEGDMLRDILAFAEERQLSQSTAANGVESASSISAKAKGKARAIDEAAHQELRKRLELARECIQHLDLDLGVLGLREAALHQKPSRRKSMSEGGSSSRLDEFSWDSSAFDQMLVFSAVDLPALFSVIIDEAKIEPGSSAAADSLYLCARYAAAFGPLGLLDDLVIGAYERIEAVIHSKPDNMALFGFWLSNMLTLLHYFRRDVALSALTSFRPTFLPEGATEVEELHSLQTQLLDLINELYVFVLRDVERRIDAVLDAAMLDYESLPFDEVRFEGEWRIAKAFSSIRAKRESTPGGASVMSLFGVDSSASSPSSDKVARRGQSMTNLRTPPSPSPTSQSPRTVTALLSALIFVLQTYRLPSYIILQALSQVIYWLSCELTNRILTRNRRHLARSRAVQIRLNASSLEDWARLNHLPTRLVSRPFEPLNALLQWLQCLSSERNLHDLLRTLRNLRSLNAAQLLKAAKEYRYEVDEPKMAEECAQYLQQMQRDWQRGRLAASLRASRGGDGSSSEEEGDMSRGEASAFDESVRVATMTRHLDEVFGEHGGGPDAFEAAEAPECWGELLDSRYMLPFAVPTDLRLLLPHRGPDTFGPLAGSASEETLHGDSPHLVPSLPEGLLARLDVAIERASAARAVAAHNGGAGLGLGLESPTLSAATARAVQGWRDRLEAEMKAVVEDRGDAAVT